MPQTEIAQSCSQSVQLVYPGQTNLFCSTSTGTSLSSCASCCQAKWGEVQWYRQLLPLWSATIRVPITLGLGQEWLCCSIHWSSPPLPLSCCHHVIRVPSLTDSLLLLPSQRQLKAAQSASISSPTGECHCCLNHTNMHPLHCSQGTRGLWTTSAVVPNLEVIRNSN